MIGRYSRLAAAVLALYRRLDRRTAVFRRATGLGCPRGCGECCLSPDVEAGVLELLPLALHLQKRGRLEPTLARLASGARPCVFYSPEPLGDFGGRCSVYPLRPLLCRLFGFSTVRDPEGRPQLALCRLVREADPAGARAAAERAASGKLAAPVMGEWSLVLYRLEPGLALPTLPLNEALGQALQRVGIAASLRRGRPHGKL